MDWVQIGEFVKSVGVPVAILFLFVGPIVYAIYRVIQKWAPAIGAKHIELVDSLKTNQEKISDSIARIADTNAQSQLNHDKTHAGIRMGYQVVYEACEGARKAVVHTGDQVLADKVLPHIDAIERLIANR